MNARTQEDVTQLKAAGRAVRGAFDAMRGACQPGITTRELDDIGAKVLKEHGAVSAPQYYYDFPGATCISVNEQAAHGISPLVCCVLYFLVSRLGRVRRTEITSSLLMTSPNCWM